MATMTSFPTLNDLPAHARVWVYKSAQPFHAAQQALIKERGAAFVRSWATHGTALLAAVEVLHGHFVVLAVDEQQVAASGCSIDTSVHFVQDLEKALGLSLTDRMVVLYEKDNAIKACRATDVERLLREGELAAGTIVFDDLVATKADLDGRFRAPLRNTWMARYL